MLRITEPFVVAASFLYYPLRIKQHCAYLIEGTKSDRYTAAQMPNVWQDGKPIRLDAELSAGSTVRVAVDEQTGAMVAVQVIEAKYDDPFA